MTFVEQTRLRVQGIFRTNGEYLFDSAFANENVLAIIPRDDDRQATTREIERDFIELRISGADPQGFLELDMG